MHASYREEVQPAGESRPALERFVPSLYTVGLLAVLGAVLIVALAPRLDTDFWWHLKVGQHIATTGSVPSRDFMSFTFAGHPWTDHEWLAELAIFGLYQLAGLWGPIVAFALIICATFATVYGTMRVRGVQPILALFVTVMAFVASSASWGPRIQMASLFFCSLFAFLLTCFNSTEDHRYLIPLPFLMLLWANIHGGFVLGLVLIVLFLAGRILNRITRVQEAVSAAGSKALVITLLVTMAVTTLNPNGYRQLLYPLAFVLPNAYTNLIEESASPNFHTILMMVFEAMLLLLIASAVVGRPRLDWIELLIAVAFTHLALGQVRNVAVWAVLVSPILASYLQPAGAALWGYVRSTPYRRRPVRRGLGPLLNLLLLLLLLVLYPLEATRYINGSALRSVEAENFPVGAIRYMQSHQLPPRVFTSYSWGGYLLWHLYPRYRDYMDSRADTLYDTTILNGYLTLYRASPNWQSILRKYRIQDVLVERDAPILQVLAEVPGWRLAYRDNVSALYVHHEGQ